MKQDQDSLPKDLFIYFDAQKAVYPSGLPVEDSRYQAVLEKINKYLDQDPESKKFSITLENEGRYRVSMDRINTGRMAVLRHIKDGTFDFDSEDFFWPNYVKELLSNESLNEGGLVLIVGEPGVGKSTTAAAMIQTRSRKYPGVTWCLEDPIEYLMESIDGPSFIFQKEVSDFEEALKDVLRAYPSRTNNTLFVGEVLSDEQAKQLLSIASNGTLVVATFHAGSIISAIQRFTGGSDSAYKVLEHNLMAIVHQSRSENSGIFYQILDCNKLNVRNLLSRERVSELHNEITVQNRRAASNI